MTLIVILLLHFGVVSPWWLIAAIIADVLISMISSS
jgi:hypothetical protein